MNNEKCQFIEQLIEDEANLEREKTLLGFSAVEWPELASKAQSPAEHLQLGAL